MADRIPMHETISRSVSVADQVHGLPSVSSKVIIKNRQLIIYLVCARCQKLGHKCSYPETLPATPTLSTLVTGSSRKQSSRNESTSTPSVQCVVCRVRHRGCDRAKPTCGTCKTYGVESQCSYGTHAVDSSIGLIKDAVHKQNGTSPSGRLQLSLLRSSNSPKTGDKRPHQSNLALAVSSNSEITSKNVNRAPGTLTPVGTCDPLLLWAKEQSSRSPKRPRTESFVSVNNLTQSALEADHPTSIHDLLRNVVRRPAPRSPPPTITGDETNFRCDLTIEINEQKGKHRNLNADCLRNVMKLLKKARIERPKNIDPEDPLMEDEWLDEDELIIICAEKLEKGGRCSRALLSRLEYFLYGPLMNAEEKRDQERQICVEECVCTSKSAPKYNLLLLRRLRRIVNDPAAYDLREHQAEIKALRGDVDAVIASKSALDRPSMKKLAYLLDPKAMTVGSHPDSPKMNAEAARNNTQLIPPNVPSKPGVLFTPSSNRSIPSNTTTRLTLFPFPSTAAKPLQFQWSSATVPSASSAQPNGSPAGDSATIPTNSSTRFATNLFSDYLPASSVIEQSEDAMRPLTKDEKKCMRPTEQALAAQRRLAAQKNTSPSLPPYIGTARPTGGRPPHRPLSTGRSTSPATPAFASPNVAPTETAGSSSGGFTRSSSIGTARPFARAQPHNSRTSTPNPALVAASSTDMPQNNNMRPASSDERPPDDLAKELWDMFLADAAHFLPIFDLDQLHVQSTLYRGSIRSMNPKLGFCLAIAAESECRFVDSDYWYGAAEENVKEDRDSLQSLEYFQQRILQIQFLILHEDFAKAWRLTGLVVADAQNNGMQYGGQSGQDEKIAAKICMVWQSLCIAKVSLSLHLGFMDQQLELSVLAPMPTISQIEESLSSSLHDGKITIAMAQFFLARASPSTRADDLICFENDMRLTRSECPMKWLSKIDQTDYRKLDRDLANWNANLPEYLQGKPSELPKDERAIIRLNFHIQVQYAYYRLRQHRPYLVLALRFSFGCACKETPHVMNTKRYDNDLDLTFVENGAVQCIKAAQEIVRSYWESRKEGHDSPLFMSQMVDSLYTAGLVLIVAGCIPWLTENPARSSMALKKDLDLLLDLLAYPTAEPNACHIVRIWSPRKMLQSISTQTCAFGRISDQNITLKASVWRKIYERLGLVIPFDSSVADSPQVGRPMHFAWVESLPIDIEDQYIL